MSAPIFYIISTEEYDALTPAPPTRLVAPKHALVKRLGSANALTWVTAPAAAHSVRSPPLTRTA